jgi:hypothetical protein
MTDNSLAGYASDFLVLVWISHTIRRTLAKRAVEIGMINTMGNIGSKPYQLIPPATSSYYIWTSLELTSSGLSMHLNIKSHLELVWRSLGEHASRHSRFALTSSISTTG